MKTSSFATRRAIVAVTSLTLTFACSSSSKSGAAATDAGGAGGTVPADLRDVERDGEGLVGTTFGPYPGRTPDYTRAASVLSLLKQVWSRSKSTNPDLPAPQTSAVDDAIAKLDTAIAAKDQQGAAYASNAIGLAVPELFDHFHPDAPIGVVRLDAMFRQVGLDAHFGHLDKAKADVSTMRADWGAIKGAVAMRVPTCHRVGGTATVGGDIEQSLANLDKALAASDAATIERESENGALEIDTLELLYDCPPDNAAPDHGLGARCSAGTPCDPGQVCDTQNAGGKCAPDPVHAKIGTACTTTVDCGDDARAACQTAAGDGYPGGYCFVEPCDDVHVCPPGATCVALGSETPGCFKSCKVDSDCRTAEGYVCQLFVTTPPDGFGPDDHACAFPCMRDSDCKQPLKCNVTSGKCTP